MASLIVAGTVCWLWSLVAIRLGPRIGYVDLPDGSDLKIHDRPAVPLGGVGVFAGFHLAQLIRGDLDLTLLWATTMVLVLGLIDDRWGLTPLVRLVVEIGAATVLVVGLRVDSHPLLIAAGVLLVVFAINAVNLFDGLDGLAASVGLVSSIGVAALASIRGFGGIEAPLAMAAALFGFLVLGWHPARVFLGDAGAYVVGMVLAAGIIQVSPAGGSDLIMAAGLLGVFAIDLMVTILRRLRSKSPLFSGDRSHLYDQLLDRGWSVRLVVFLAVAVQVVLVAGVVAVDTWISGVPGVVIMGGLWLLVIGVLAQRGFLGPRVGTGGPGLS